jgi:hypothetical protein
MKKAAERCDCEQNETLRLELVMRIKSIVSSAEKRAQLKSHMKNENSFACFSLNSAIL